MLLSGKLDKRIAIQRMEEVRDEETGALVRRWKDWKNVWAAVQPIQGREYWAAQAEQSEATTRIRIRALQGITTKDRVLFRDAIYDIVSIIEPSMNNEEMQIMAKSGSSDG